MLYCVIVYQCHYDAYSSVMYGIKNVAVHILCIQCELLKHKFAWKCADSSGNHTFLNTVCFYHIQFNLLFLQNISFAGCYFVCYVDDIKYPNHSVSMYSLVYTNEQYMIHRLIYWWHHLWFIALALPIHHRAAHMSSGEQHRYAVSTV